MNKIVKLTVVLFLVCAIVAGVLGGVNLITKDKIAEQDRIKTEKAYAAVLVSDNGYTEVSFDKTAFPTVDSINECNNGAGWVVTTTFSGAQGSITMGCRRRYRHEVHRHFHHLPRRDLRPRRKGSCRQRIRRLVARPVRRHGR